MTKIRLTREVRVALGSAAAHPTTGWRNGWAGWPVAVGLAPHVTIRVSVIGDPHPQTGYLCDIRVLDDLVRERGLAILEEALPSRSIEETLLHLRDELDDKSPLPIDRIECFLTPYRRYDVAGGTTSMIRMTEQFEFSASHRLHCPEYSDDKNRTLFGKCNNPNGHGHNYLVEVTIEGRPNPETGSLFPVGALADIVQERVLSRFDHKHLNTDTTEFQRRNPSVENIADEVWNLLVDHLSPARLFRVRVYETAKTWADREA
jgi:6-pyruvoyltetrahydropterin/6-carboxytetrahydropterin synthase